MLKQWTLFGLIFCTITLLGSSTPTFAYGGGGCQSQVICKNGSANCQAALSSESNSDFTDNGICGNDARFRKCHVLRRFDRGNLAGTEATINKSYICCLADGTAIATPTQELAEKRCDNIGTSD